MHNEVQYISVLEQSPVVNSLLRTVTIWTPLWQALKLNIYSRKTVPLYSLNYITVKSIQSKQKNTDNRVLCVRDPERHSKWLNEILFVNEDIVWIAPKAEASRNKGRMWPRHCVPHTLRKYCARKCLSNPLHDETVSLWYVTLANPDSTP